MGRSLASEPDNLGLVVVSLGIAVDVPQVLRLNHEIPLKSPIGRMHRCALDLLDSDKNAAHWTIHHAGVPASLILTIAQIVTL